MFFSSKNKPNDEFLTKIYENQGIIHKVCNLYSDNEDDRKDLFQDMLLQLWKAHATFKSNSKWSTWMYSVCLNTALNTLRKNIRSKSFFSLELLHSEPVEPTPEYFENKTEVAMLHRAIAELAEVDRAIIMLYLEERTYDEIATIVGITISNVGAKISRIKGKLELKLKTNY